MAITGLGESSTKDCNPHEAELKPAPCMVSRMEKKLISFRGVATGVLLAAAGSALAVLAPATASADSVRITSDPDSVRITSVTDGTDREHIMGNPR